MFLDDSGDERRARRAMDWDSLEQVLQNARKCFLRDDVALLFNDANERSMTHKFAECLQKEFGDMDVDCEYNRDRSLPKKLTALAKTEVSIDDTDGATVFPDIIVHRRNTGYNLLVIEAKKGSRAAGIAYDLTQRDRTKLEAFCEEMGYKFGVLLFFRTGCAPDVTWERHPSAPGRIDENR